jgi:hypothetical protein
VDSVHPSDLFVLITCVTVMCTVETFSPFVRRTGVVVGLRIADDSTADSTCAAVSISRLFCSNLGQFLDLRSTLALVNVLSDGICEQSELLRESEDPAFAELDETPSNFDVAKQIRMLGYRLRTVAAGLSVRRPANEACRRLPPTVHSVNVTSTTTRGFTQRSFGMSSAEIPSPQ